MTTITYETELLPQPQLNMPTLDYARVPGQIENQPFVEFPNVPIPKGIDHIGSFNINNLATSENIAKLQNDTNILMEKVYKESTWKGLTLRLAVRDAYEALTGIPEDIYQNSGKVSLKELLMKNNRLRGLGLLLVVISLVSILLFIVG